MSVGAASVRPRKPENRPARAAGAGAGRQRRRRRRLLRLGPGGRRGAAAARQTTLERGDRRGLPVGAGGGDLGGDLAVGRLGQDQVVLVERLLRPGRQTRGLRELRDRDGAHGLVGTVVAAAAVRQAERGLTVGQRGEVDLFDDGRLDLRQARVVARCGEGGGRPVAVQVGLGHHEQRRGEPDDRLGAGAVRGLEQPDVGAQALGDAADDEEAEALVAQGVAGGRRDDLRVRGLELLRRSCPGPGRGCGRPRTGPRHRW